MRIALLEDDNDLAIEVRALLEGSGYDVALFGDGIQLIRALARDHFDLFVLDWYVPGMTGLDVLLYLRERLRLNSPVMFLTSNSGEEQVVAALSAGADDYCAKPLRTQEFLARVKSIQRRSGPGSTTAPLAEVESIPGYAFNAVQRTVEVDGQAVSLTEKEFELACLLFQNVGAPLSRSRIMSQVWGRDEDPNSRTLDVHISWLRRKLGLGADGRRMRLMVIHGYGYRLVKLDGSEEAGSEAGA